MSTININVKAIKKGMSPVEKSNTAAKCRQAAQKYSEVSACLDEAGVALENDRFDKCVTSLEKAKSSLE